MVRIVWAKGATDDLDAIRHYVEDFDPVAATRLTLRLLNAGDSLSDFPERGRSIGHGRRALTTIWPYLILDRVDGDLVRILSVRHGARRPPER